MLFAYRSKDTYSKNRCRKRLEYLMTVTYFYFYVLLSLSLGCISYRNTSLASGAHKKCYWCC